MLPSAVLFSAVARLPANVSWKFSWGRRSGLAPAHASLVFGLFSKLFPFLAGAVSRRHVALWIIRSQWPVWPIARRVCLRECDPFLRARIPRPGSTVLCLLVYRGERARWFVSPA